MADLTVLGIGNILMQDEGVGVRLLEEIQQRRTWPESIEFVDGGAGGLNLLNVIESAQKMVVFDAAEMKLAPGEFRIITPAQVVDEPMDHRISMHDEPLTETLKLCEQFSHRPDTIKILVVQPASIDFGTKLTPTIKAVFDKLADAAQKLVEQVAQIE